MQRYFVNEDKNNCILFNEQDVFHICKVMRNKINDEIEIVLNAKAYVANIDCLNPLRVHIISEKQENSELKVKLCLFVPLLKSDKAELIIQKATEIGVTNIIFYQSKRSIIHLDQTDFEKKKTRYNSIAKEASEQCHRTIIPSIDGIISLSSIDSYKCDNNILAYEMMCGNTSSFDNELTKSGSFSLIVGPEGGFDEGEVNLLVEHGFTPVSLGKRILRVETAAIYGLSVISYTLDK